MPIQTLEGRQSVLAALRARQRRFQVVLVRHDAHAEKVQDVLDLAAEMSVPVRRVDARELDSLARGVSHGGVLAIASEKPGMSGEAFVRLVGWLSQPPRLLLPESARLC